jgi:sigma-B regulation protein RsbU (phosphoserine phosphatase)
MQDSCVAMAIGDVAGKGISAALLMASIQSIMRTQLSSVVSELAQSRGIAHHAFSTAQMVALLNKQLFASTSLEKFATFYFGVYDPPTATLRYTNAGHLPPILVRDGSPQLLEVTGMVVGAFPFSTYEEKSVELRAGDLLVAYTDGIVEPEDVYGEMFGEERLIDLLLTHKERAIEEIIARVMEAVRQWTGTPELQDDMTMLVMRRI